jgi:hypothetical protein
MGKIGMKKWNPLETGVTPKVGAKTGDLLNNSGIRFRVDIFTGWVNALRSPKLMTTSNP